MSKPTTSQSHVFVTETESAQETFNYKVTPYELLLDLKVLMSEYYVATFDVNNEKLLLNFNNGQRFVIKIEEIAD